MTNVRERMHVLLPSTCRVRKSKLPGAPCLRMAPAALGEGESQWPRVERGTPTPRRHGGVPGASAGGERGSSAPPPIRRRGKEVEEKCPHRHSAPALRQRRLRTFERPGLPVRTGDAAPRWSVRRSANSAALASPPAGRRRLRTDRSSLWFASTLGSCGNGQPRSGLLAPCSLPRPRLARLPGPVSLYADQL